MPIVFVERSCWLKPINGLAFSTHNSKELTGASSLAFRGSLPQQQQRQQRSRVRALKDNARAVLLPTCDDVLVNDTFETAFLAQWANFGFTGVHLRKIVQRL